MKTIGMLKEDWLVDHLIGDLRPLSEVKKFSKKKRLNFVVFALAGTKLFRSKNGWSDDSSDFLDMPDRWAHRYLEFL